MTLTLLTAALSLSLAADPPADKPRPPNLFAPSLPQLTKDEEDQLDGVIDRFGSNSQSSNRRPQA